MSDDDVRKQFDDLISGADLEDLRRASWQLLAADAPVSSIRRPWDSGNSAVGAPQAGASRQGCEVAATGRRAANQRSAQRDA